MDLMELIGDTPAAKELVSQAKRWKLIESGIRISENEPTPADIAFMAVFLVQCTLPHSDPGDLPAWVRRNGDLTLVVQPGWDLKTNSSTGYPYGSISRLLLFWIITEAIRTKSRRIELGHSLTEFLRMGGMNPDNGTGKRSDSRRLKEQMQRLFSAMITFHRIIEEPYRRGEQRREMQVAAESELWWDTKHPDQSALWGSWIELGEKFYEAINGWGVIPFDLRHIKELRRSPLALDLYTLLNYLGATVTKPKKMAWALLMEQLGGDYKHVQHFRSKATAALLKVSDVHRGLNVKRYNGGIVVSPSRPAVPRRHQVG